MEFQEAVDKFLKNPYWKGVYDGASERCKQFYEQNFAYSLGAVKKEDHQREVIALYKTFAPADWDYLIGHTHQNMCKWGYEQARKKYEKREK